MTQKESDAALKDATDKLAEQSSNDGADAERARDERAEAEKKLTEKE